MIQNSANVAAIIREYVQEAFLMQIATSSGGKPWISTVHYAEDDELNLYWISSANSRHSHEITSNNHVAAAIVLPHTEEDAPRGLQIEGVVEELLRESSSDALLEYAQKFGATRKKLDYFVKNKGGHVFYKLRPSIIYLYDEINFPESPKQELILSN